MKNIVIHMAKVPKGESTIASLKIAKLLQDVLQCDIMDRGAQRWIKAYDTVFIVNTPSAFCDFLEEIVDVCTMSKRLVWVMNDYNIYPPTQLRHYLYKSKRRLELWGTLPRIPDDFHRRATYGNLEQKASKVFNFNSLSYDPLVRVAPTIRGIIYWGALRPDRIEDFERYLFPATYLLTISTSRKTKGRWNDCFRNFTGHKELPINVDLIEPLEPLVPSLQQFPATIYMEDKFSHGTFCQPANRFYEALSAGIANFIDVRATKTLLDAGYQVPPDMIVYDKATISDRLKRATEIAGAQRNLWSAEAQRQKDTLLSSLKDAVTSQGIV